VTEFHIVTFVTGYYFAGVILLQFLRRIGWFLKQDEALAYLLPALVWPIVLIIAAVWMLARLCQRLVEGARE
jgi:hypothetical protein